MIIAATRGQQHLGDNGLGHGPVRWAPVALQGQVRAPRQSMRSRGTEGHRLARHHLVVYTWMDPYGVLWQPLGYTRDTILGDLSQGLGLLLGEDLPRPIVRRGCVVKTMIFGCGTAQGVSLVIGFAR